MKKRHDQKMKDKGISLLFSIVLVFGILSVVVFSVARKISIEMSDSAIQNLSESLDLIKCTIESILNKEAEFQKLMAKEAAKAENPEDYILSYEKTQAMVKVSLIGSGETEGISSTGEIFSEDGLEFAPSGILDGLEISQSYVNYMGTWAYSMKCPVIKDGQEIADLYVEYIYDSFDRSLPEGFYDKRAMLYIMDAQTQRFVLKPKGMGERNAGHLNLEDFYRANDIKEEEIRANISECVENGKNIMFYHNVRNKKALNYMWTVNEGTIYLVGYVPIEAIQQEGKTVNQNILIVVSVMLIAFFLCFILYYFNQRQQNKLRKEREAERELHNKQLAEALHAAQLASNSKTMFLSNMSHDIRTPMNAVLGFTALLSKDAENPDRVKEYTKKIMASGQHLLSLINDILDVSKIESGKVVLTVERFTLSDMVSSVDAIIRPMAAAREQKFHVEVTDVKHEYLLGDETRVNQILINLLSNAVKYTPVGGNIWFRIIGMKQRSTQYEHIQIEVEDDGYGMTPEYLKTIFDAFTRAENSTTNKVQGTGLGMAITKNIVELMGGTIDVSSEVNKGSLFRVELEFRIPEEQADKQFWINSGITRVLAVEGDVRYGENIQMLMKDTGVEVDTALNGEEALRQIQDGRRIGKAYQLVLFDWDVQGDMQIINRIQEALQNTAPILFLVSYDIGCTEELLRGENTDILQKPFFVSSLKQKVAEIQAGKKKEKEFEEEEDGNLEGLRFLAAEDNEINAEILAEILSMEGAYCEIVENGQLVLERFINSEEGEFDAILMDVQMPVMNGYEATRAIRALERKDARTMPIIAMTANAFVEDEKEALNAGMNVHLAKPIDIDLLKKVIKQYT
ncbi:ATP-binding response regulator [Parablautia intestinalis]|uniref:ATP-binding response regulator n=1 Tax=Parablautia intestinalis TaxID=2320100 RepID=UPI00256F5FEC|nr:ATP-binding protein [Parablautia intestinalis]